VAKRIHRSKIDEDQFVIRSGEFLAAALPYWQKHKTAIVRGLIAAGLLVILTFVVGIYLHKSAERLQASLDDALASAEPAPEAPEAPPSNQQERDKLEGFLRDHPSGTPAAWAHFHLAEALLEDGQAEPAVEHYRKFLELAPKSAVSLGRLALGFALVKSGKPADAITEWEALKSSGWTGDDLELEIATARLQSDREKGLSELRVIADKKDSAVAEEAKQRLALYAPKAEGANSFQGVPDPAAAATPATGTSSEASGTPAAAPPTPAAHALAASTPVHHVVAPPAAAGSTPAAAHPSSDSESAPLQRTPAP
jgi:tetratricopeptide (TPR) repeat protein